MSRYKTPIGDLEIADTENAAVLMTWNGKNIYLDPDGGISDFSGMPVADLILISDEYRNRITPRVSENIVTEKTIFIVSRSVKSDFPNTIVLPNNDRDSFEQISVTAVPAYGISRRDGEGNLYCPKGEGNGYVLDFSGFRIYFSGDTEPVPEMEHLRGCQVAFLSKNPPRSMDDVEFVKAANMIRPKFLHPYRSPELDVPSLFRNLDTGIVIVTR